MKNILSRFCLGAIFFMMLTTEAYYYYLDFNVIPRNCLSTFCSLKKHNDCLPLFSALTIGLSVASALLLVIGAIGAFVFFRYKKHQSRYGQHELLVNNDDDDPIDVST